MRKDLSFMIRDLRRPRQDLTLEERQHWKSLKKQHLDLYGPKCCVCGQTEYPLELHHNDYDRFGHELFSDVILLCLGCHQRHHSLPQSKRTKVRELRHPRGESVEIERLASPAIETPAYQPCQVPKSRSWHSK